jgi:hypothetical protein
VKGIKRIFLGLVTLVLVVTGVAKVGTALGGGPGYGEADVVFPFLSLRQLLALAGLLELGCVAWVLRAGQATSKALLILWLSSLFWVYRLGLKLAEVPGPCPCLGAVSQRSAGWAERLDAALWGSLGFMTLGAGGWLVASAIARCRCRQRQGPALRAGLGARGGTDARRRQPVGVCLALGWVTVALWLGGTALAEAPPLEPAQALATVKRFITAPPTVSNMVYRLHAAGYRNAPLANYIDRTLHARWSPTSFYFRQISSLEDLTNTAIIAGILVAYTDTDFWRYNKGFGYVHWDARGRPAGDAGRFPVTVWETQFLGVLRMGVRALWTNPVVWVDERRFRATNVDGHLVQGTILLDAQGLPTGLEMLYGERGKAPIPAGVSDEMRRELEEQYRHVAELAPFTGRVEYAYTTNVGVPGFPSRITHRLPPDNPQYDWEYTIALLQTTEEPLAPELTSIRRFLLENPQPMCVQTNGDLVRVGMSTNPFTQWSVVPYVPPRQAYRPPYWIWGLTALLLGAPVVFLLRRKGQPQQHHSNRR